MTEEQKELLKNWHQRFVSNFLDDSNPSVEPTWVDAVGCVSPVVSFIRDLLAAKNAECAEKVVEERGRVIKIINDFEWNMDSKTCDAIKKCILSPNPPQE